MTIEGFLLVVALGLTAGVLAGLFGIGGGVLMVPAMVLVLGFEQHLAAGTSLVVIIPTAVIGAYAHYRHGYVHLDYAAALAVGGIIGAFIGSNGALAINARTLQLIFVLYLVVMGVRMLLPRGTSLRSLLGGPAHADSGKGTSQGGAGDG